MPIIDEEKLQPGNRITRAQERERITHGGKPSIFKSLSAQKARVAMLNIPPPNTADAGVLHDFERVIDHLKRNLPLPGEYNSDEEYMYEALLRWIFVGWIEALLC